MRDNKPDSHNNLKYFTLQQYVRYLAGIILFLMVTNYLLDNMNTTKQNTMQVDPPIVFRIELLFIKKSMKFDMIFNIFRQMARFTSMPTHV